MKSVNENYFYYLHFYNIAYPIELNSTEIYIIVTNSILLVVDAHDISRRKLKRYVRFCFSNTVLMGNLYGRYKTSRVRDSLWLHKS